MVLYKRNLNTNNYVDPATEWYTKKIWNPGELSGDMTLSTEENSNIFLSYLPPPKKKKPILENKHVAGSYISPVLASNITTLLSVTENGFQALPRFVFWLFCVFPLIVHHNISLCHQTL